VLAVGDHERRVEGLDDNLDLAVASAKPGSTRALSGTTDDGTGPPGTRRRVTSSPRSSARTASVTDSPKPGAPACPAAARCSSNCNDLTLTPPSQKRTVSSAQTWVLQTRTPWEEAVRGWPARRQGSEDSAVEARAWGVRVKAFVCLGPAPGQRFAAVRADPRRWTVPPIHSPPSPHLLPGAIAAPDRRLSRAGSVPQPSGMRDAFAPSQTSNVWSAGFNARATSGERRRRNSSPRMEWCSYMFPMSSAPGKPSAR